MNSQSILPPLQTSASFVLSDTEAFADEMVLTQAWQWLCETRKVAPANADIWDLRYRWETERAGFLQQLQQGTYQLKPMQVVGRARRAMWCAEDALALKWVTLRLQGHLPLHEKCEHQGHLPLHEKCEHVEGHGGGKSSITRLPQTIRAQSYAWVCRTDIRGYYGAIDKSRLLSQLKRHIARLSYVSLLTQYLHYSIEEGGEFYTPEKGIARGCALSPLMGALHLWVMDDYFTRQKKVCYVRYMDDFVLLAESRWALRKQVKALNRYFVEFGFEKHPDKTFIGCVQRGFDWMGAWLTHKGVEGIAPRALENHREKVQRLYEQTRSWPKARQIQRVLNYRKRWKIWAVGIFLAPTVQAAVVTPGDSITTSGSWRWAWSQTSQKSRLFPPGLGVDFAVNLATSGLVGSYCATTENFDLRTTSDGYRGLHIANDVVLGLSGTATANRSPAPARMSIGTWSKQGVFNTTGPGPEPGYTWCGAGVDTNALYTFTPGEYSVTFTGSWFIHAGPLATKGTYTYPAVILGRMHPDHSDPATVIVPAGAVTVDTPLKCSISAPPLIKFKKVQLTGNERYGEILDYHNGNISIDCSSGFPPATTSVTIAGNTGRFTDTLRLNGTSAPAAEIKGLIGLPLPPAGSCSAYDDGYRNVIQFNPSYPINVGHLEVGNNLIPYNFTLCSTGVFAVGEATATATMDIKWE